MKDKTIATAGACLLYTVGAAAGAQPAAYAQLPLDAPVFEPIGISTNTADLPAIHGASIAETGLAGDVTVPQHIRDIVARMIGRKP